MIEHTSMEISRQLAALGFKADIDAWHIDEGGMALMPNGSSLLPSVDVDCVPIMPQYPAYRADTLLAFLVGKGWDISIGKPHDKVLVDAASMKLNVRLAVEEDTIADALADVVFAILAPPPKGK